MPIGIYERKKPPWNKGKKGVLVAWNKGLTAETDDRVRRMSKSKIGQKRTKKSRQKMRKAHLGTKQVEETKRKRKETWRKKKENGYVGKPPWNKGLFKEVDKRVKKNGRSISKAKKGIPLSEEFKKQLREIWKSKYESGYVNPLCGVTGENHPSWKGGLSFFPYPLEFNDELKIYIRERDKYICQICGEWGNCVHHIDYNKKNCNERNLITTCGKCHTTTNYNRIDWEIGFYFLLGLTSSNFDI